MKDEREFVFRINHQTASVRAFSSFILHPSSFPLSIWRRASDCSTRTEDSRFPITAKTPSEPSVPVDGIVAGKQGASGARVGVCHDRPIHFVRFDVGRVDDGRCDGAGYADDVQV